MEPHPNPSAVGDNGWWHPTRGQYGEAVACFVGLLILGFVTFQTFDYAKLIVQGEWHTATVVGHSKKLECDDKTCGMLVDYTHLEYRDKSGNAHKIAIGGEKYTTATVKVFANPPDSPVVTSLWQAYVTAGLWGVYVFFYICFLMAIVGDKGGSVQIDGIS
jgi:hypothetical protein